MTKLTKFFFSFQGEYRTDDITILNTTGSAPSVIQSCDTTTPPPPSIPTLTGTVASSHVYIHTLHCTSVLL